jgi:hypothetical protein
MRNSTYQVGELIGWAEWEPPAPQLHIPHELAVGLTPVDMAPYGDDPAIGARLRKRQEKWHATQFRALPRPGQPAVKAAAARDGQNRVATAESGTAPLPRGEETGGAANARSQETGGASARATLPLPATRNPEPGIRNASGNRAADDPMLREFLDEDELDALHVA